MLRIRNNARRLATTSDDSAALSRLGGAEVVVRGRAEGDLFKVATFTVRGVDGALVADGVLLRAGDRFVLQTQNGRLALGNPPATFGMLIGARIWIGGPLEKGPNVYGVIVPSSLQRTR